MTGCNITMTDTKQGAVVTAADEMSTQGLSWDNYVVKLIDAFRPFLLETLEVSHILPFIDIKELDDRFTRSVHYLENKKSDATEIFLDAIKESKQQGKGQMFINALREVGDTAILNRLFGKECKESDRRHYDPHLCDVIKLFAQPLQTNLNLQALLPEMKQRDLLEEGDMQAVEGKLEQGKLKSANGLLIAAMTSHNHDWYAIFLTILYQDVHHRELAKLVDDDFCQKLEARRASREGTQAEQQGTSTEMEFHIPVSTTHSTPREAEPARPPSETTQAAGEVNGADVAVGPSAFSHQQQGEVTNAQLIAEVTALRSTNESLRSAVTRLESTVTSLESTVSSMCSDLADMKTMLRTLLDNGKQHESRTRTQRHTHTHTHLATHTAD